MTVRPTPSLRILGTRGIPNRHGGFESFAEALALHLVAQGWKVTVYCQESDGIATHESEWRGVRRIHIPVRPTGAFGTVIFDWLSTKHALQEAGVALVLGYNTAIFSLAYRVRGIPNLLNMDGMEWQRAKYGKAAKLWFFLNEWAGTWIADHLIADHPTIAARLARRVRGSRLSMIPYSAPPLTSAPEQPLAAFGIRPQQYALLVARPEPENSIMDIVAAWSRERRGVPLVVLGNYGAGCGPYAARVRASAGPDVLFPGAIYEPEVVGALRSHARFYFHGHRAGGTNPSLVESLAAGTPVIAHDNPYNRWVANGAGDYFSNETECAEALDALLAPEGRQRLKQMRLAAFERHRDAFTPGRVLGAYEQLLTRMALGTVAAMPVEEWETSHA